MTEGGGSGVEQEAGQTPVGFTRRNFLAAAAVTGAGAIAAVAGVFRTAERMGVLKEKQDKPIPSTEKQVVSTEISGISERWSVSNKADIDGTKIDIKPSIRPVLSKEGQQLGQVLECMLEVNPGDQQASLDFIFKKDPQGNYYVITNGEQSWSSSVWKVGHNADQMVGMRSLEKSLGGKTVPFYDPGPGGERIPATEGRSYGWVGFRELDPSNAQSKENLVLGVIPGFDSLEGIRYRQEGDNVIVSVAKNLEGVSTQRLVTFKVFLGSVNRFPTGEQADLKYADLMLAFSKELSRQVDIPLMKDRVIGFSWPVYAKEVTQDDVRKEIAAGKGIFDTYIIDDGWETNSGSLTVNQGKFPDFSGLAKQMTDLGIKPGIWVSPFKVTDQDAKKLPREWFMKDGQGKPRRIPLPGIAGVFERSFMLDISNSDVRKYLNSKLVDIAQAGFAVFKADFLMVPFTGELQNKEKTSVEYYRQFFEEFRQSIRDQLGKEIEIIGCGAPLMESIGLFNGMRMTGDSAVPLETFVPLPNVVRRLTRTQLIGGAANTELYHDAVAVGDRRILPLNNSYGLIWDGVHIADKETPFSPDKREALNESRMAADRLGVGNLFVGDSLARIGEQGRQAWRDFIRTFKMGNVELKFGDIKSGIRKLPKISERYVTPKAS